MKASVYVEYQETQVQEKNLITKAKEIWKKKGKKAAELKDLQLYIKPEENMAYCVFNEEETAEFSLD